MIKDRLQRVVILILAMGASQVPVAGAHQFLREGLGSYEDDSPNETLSRMLGKGSKGNSSSKGKGKGSSTLAPSSFPSSGPSFSPSIAPSTSPTLTFAPTTFLPEVSLGGIVCDLLFQGDKDPNLAEISQDVVGLIQQTFGRVETFLNTVTDFFDEIVNDLGSFTSLMGEVQAILNSSNLDEDGVFKVFQTAKNALGTFFRTVPGAIQVVIDNLNDAAEETDLLETAKTGFEFVIEDGKMALECTTQFFKELVTGDFAIGNNEEETRRLQIASALERLVSIVTPRPVKVLSDGTVELGPEFRKQNTFIVLAPIIKQLIAFMDSIGESALNTIDEACDALPDLVVGAVVLGGATVPIPIEEICEFVFAFVTVFLAEVKGLAEDFQSLVDTLKDLSEVYNSVLEAVKDEITYINVVVARLGDGEERAARAVSILEDLGIPYAFEEVP